MKTQPPVLHSIKVQYFMLGFEGRLMHLIHEVNRKYFIRLKLLGR